MIKIVGTSHVSKESIKRIDEAFEEFDPDVVCLELDIGRLNALINDEKADPENYLHLILGKFQQYIGKKTGLMPGEEMLHAYEEACKREDEIYLIDRDIRKTLARVKDVRRKEKAKALMMLPFSVFNTGIDVSKIPEEQIIEDMKQKFAESFPELYQVLLVERDVYMSHALEKVLSENPDKDILVVVGAAHEKGLRERFNEINSQDPVEEKE